MMEVERIWLASLILTDLPLIHNFGWKICQWKHCNNILPLQNRLKHFYSFNKINPLHWCLHLELNAHWIHPISLKIRQQACVTSKTCSKSLFRAQYKGTRQSLHWKRHALLPVICILMRATAIMKIRGGTRVEVIIYIYISLYVS